MVTKYCPRCDRSITATTEKAAFDGLRAHLARQEDELHDGALEEFDDQTEDDLINGKTVQQ